MFKNNKTKITIPLLRLEYTDEEIKFIQDGVKDILESGYLTMSSKVKEFEQEFSDFIDIKFSFLNIDFLYSKDKDMLELNIIKRKNTK